MSANLKLFLLFSQLCLCLGSVRDGWPGYSYHSELNGWLKLHEEPDTWRAARIACHLEGAFLTSSWTAEFASSLHQLQSGGQQSSEDTVPAIYTGFHTTSAEGAFTFVNGKPAITLDHDGLAALERCVAFFVNGTSGEVSCDTLLPYVCFAPAPAPTPAPTSAPTTACTLVTTSAPTTCLCDGYKKESKTGHWYKFHAEGKSWSDARKACEAEEARLAVINSAEEAQVLVALYEKYKPQIHDAYSDIWVHIGHYKEPSLGWRTINGQTLEEAGYVHWYPGHPMQQGKEGQMTWDGRLLSFNDYALAFICEKSIN